jgi:Aminoglycoside-2''-adenylyltransferase
VTDAALPPVSVGSVVAPLGLWWGIAGGWAIDLWLGRETREHHDVEVVFQRSDQASVYEQLSSAWVLRLIDPPGSGWRRWEGEKVEAPAFQAKAVQRGTEFDIFFEDVETSCWTFRRDPLICRPIGDVLAQTECGLPVVRPEIQLLYMAGHSEPKHDHDLISVLPRLDTEERRWLRTSLSRVAAQHPWLARLDS